MSDKIEVSPNKMKMIRGNFRKDCVEFLGFRDKVRSSGQVKINKKDRRKTSVRRN